MKIAHAVVFALALVMVVVCIAGQRFLISKQESKNQMLRKQIEKAKGDFQVTPPRKGMAMETKKNGGSWKEIAKGLGEDGGNGEAKDLEERLAGMSSRDVLNALKEISTSQMEPEKKDDLESLLADALIEKDPELALKTYAERIGKEDDPIAWQLPVALANWAKKSPKEAAAWLDEKIAAGLFESKSLDGHEQARIEFEAALVGELLMSDPQQAAERIAQLPEDQRREALEGVSLPDLNANGQNAYAALVRGLVPQDERAGVFAHVAGEMAGDGGLEKVEEFLNLSKATPEERAVAAREAGNNQLEDISSERAVTQQDVDAMRNWVKKQAPGTEDQVTGEALARASQDGAGFGIKQATALALEYNKRSPGDAVLIAFLKGLGAQSNQEAAMPLVEKIRDPASRQEVLHSLQSPEENSPS